MQELADTKAPGKRLVLGFDAGCSTCSELARRIEDRIGEKIEVRSLDDPQMVHWRGKALGDGAAWAPTLVEIRGGEAKAWTGLRMGARLSISLGPAATWRVMQILGEMNTVPAGGTSAAAGGLSRGQFLKGLGGAAVAMSILSSTGKIPSSATAAEATSASPAERTKVLSIVRSSTQYEDLAGEVVQRAGEARAGVGSTFDLARAEVKVDRASGIAVLGVPTKKQNNGSYVVALFYVDLLQKAVFYFCHMVLVPNGGEEYAVTRYDDGELLDRLTAGKDYIVTPDGRRLSNQQFIREAQSEDALRMVQAHGHKYRRCVYRISRSCGLGLIIGCARLGPLASLACGLAAFNGGCGSAARKICYRRYCTYVGRRGGRYSKPCA